MKHNKITYLLLLAVVALLTTSCNDWLTLYPQNKVTEEQFWEDKNDLEGVRNAAYRSFASGGMVERILNWGEARSDNFTHSSYENSTGYRQYEEMRSGRLDTTSSYFEWASIYTTINYCNKVLEHGEEVLQNDKQFTQSQWNSIKAEMIALRALNYFYLVRAFSDVPIVMHSINTDAQVTSTPQSPMIEVLDTIINDVKSIETGYATTNQNKLEDTKCTFTQPAIDALLADMLLWRGSYWEGRDSIDWARSDYREAVFYAQKSFDGLERQNQNSVAGGFTSTLSNTKDNGKYNLIQNYRDVNSVSTLNFRAYTEIFNDFYSDETILEMPFTSEDKVKDDVLDNYFGIVDESSERRFSSAVMDIMQTCYPQSYSWEKSGTWLEGNIDELQDLRMRYNAAYTSDKIYEMPKSMTGVSSNGYIMKYRDLYCSSPEVVNGKSTLKLTLTFSTLDYKNFIIYRKSDVLLIKAEALACLGEDLGEVANILYELRLRSSENRGALSLKDFQNKYIGKLLDPNPEELKYRSKSAYRHLLAVMHERQLELYAEGKRWFDIVRWAERNQNRYMESSQGAEYQAFETFFKNQTLRQNAQGRLKSRWALYNPVFWSEREASGYVLKQNPYWDDDLTTN